MFMNALSVMEPWASLIIKAGKDVENRTWYCGYRGPLVICASKRVDPGWNQEDWEFELDCEFAGLNLPQKMKDFVKPGYALGIVNVIGCDKKETGNKWECSDQYHIHLTDAKPFMNPFPVSGRLGIFQINVPPDVMIEAPGGENEGYLPIREEV
jgi:hypothetical protein